jgi:hypothetical protein
VTITSSLYTKLAKDKSARIVLKQSGGPEGFKRKTQKTRVDVTIKRAQGVSVDRSAKVKVIMLDNKEQLETFFLTNSRDVVC